VRWAGNIAYMGEIRNAHSVCQKNYREETAREPNELMEG
jgi:hypothetical protein